MELKQFMIVALTWYIPYLENDHKNISWSAVSSRSGVRDRAPAENEFGAL